MTNLEGARKAKKNPAEALRQRIQAAATLLEQHPGDLADRLLSILRPDQP